MKQCDRCGKDETTTTFSDKYCLQPMSGEIVCDPCLEKEHNEMKEYLAERRYFERETFETMSGADYDDIYDPMDCYVKY